MIKNTTLDRYIVAAQLKATFSIDAEQELADILQMELNRELISQNLDVASDMVPDAVCLKQGWNGLALRRALLVAQPPEFLGKKATFDLYTQKPRALMTWCTENLSMPVDLSIDWENTRVTLTFETDEDAAFFRLKWS